MGNLLKDSKIKYASLMGPGKADEIAEEIRKTMEIKKSEDEGLPLVDLDTPIH